jgi:hypothetical protein
MGGRYGDIDNLIGFNDQHRGGHKFPFSFALFSFALFPFFPRT